LAPVALTSELYTGVVRLSTSGFAGENATDTCVVHSHYSLNFAARGARIGEASRRCNLGPSLIRVAL
jgi:hypothetical protein